MRILHHVAVLAVFAALLAGGVALVAIALSGGWWNAFEAYVAREGRMPAFSLGLGLACAALLMALTDARLRDREQLLSFANADGRVTISTVAICDYIGRLASEFPSVVALTPRVFPRRNVVDVVVSLRVKPSPQIHEVCEVLQKRIRETLLNGLGIAEVGRIEVSVRQISSEYKAV